MNKILHIISKTWALQVIMIKASLYKITIGVCSYLVVRARNEKLARHLLSYQPVAAGPQGKLLVFKVLLLIDYQRKELTLREHT
jgi:hypothetical protein